MKFILTSQPVSGHLNPLLGIARRLVARGDDVVVYTGSSLRSRVERSGARFHPLPESVDYNLTNVEDAFPERSQIPPGPDQLIFDFENFFLNPMVAQYQGLSRLLAAFPADAIITENLFYGAVPVMLGADRRRPAVFGCGTTILTLDRDDGAPCGPGFPYTEDPSVMQQYRDTVAQMVPLYDRLQATYEARLAELGVLPSGTHFSSVLNLKPQAFWQGCVPEFEYPRKSLPPHIRFVGAVPHLPADVPLPSWAADLDGSRKVVFVTQGTLANESFEELVLPTFEAFRDDPNVLVVATGGGRPTEDIAARLPRNGRIADYLPLDWLFPKTDLMVTNGGYGTVGQALSAGVPVIVAGTTEDKPEVAARVEWSGVGVNLRTKTPTPEAVRSAGVMMLQSVSYRDKAQAMAARYASFDAIKLIFDDIDRVVAHQGLVDADA